MNWLQRIFKKPPQKDERDEFAALVRAKLEQSGLRRLLYNKAEFSFRAEGQERTIYLNNAYSDFCNAPANQRIAITERYVKAFLQLPREGPKDLQELKHQLRPFVRDAAFFSLTELKLRADRRDISGLQCPTRLLAPGLQAGLARDTEHAIEYVNRGTLEKWGLSFDEGFTIALENLRTRTSSEGLREVQPGLYASQYGDSYDSSRFLLPEVFQSLKLDGDPIAFMPIRDQLWITGERNHSAIGAILKDGAESHFDMGHSLSCELYKWSDGAWQVYLPQDEGQREKCLAMRRRRAGIDYVQQAGDLNKIYVRDKIDVFVASILLFKDKEKSLNLCIWADGVDSLLPKAEIVAVAINKDAKSHILVPWDTLVSVVGTLMEEQPELMPVRYRVRSFPNPSQLEELRRRSAHL
jgi:hypothetical protein